MTLDLTGLPPTPAEVDAFLADLDHARKDGFTAYKVHPPWLAGNTVDFRLDIAVARALRKHAGDEYALLWDRVGGYTRGKILDKPLSAEFPEAIFQ